MVNVKVSDDKKYTLEIVSRYIKLFRLIAQHGVEYTLSIEAFNRMIMERLTTRENIVIRLLYGLGFCCEECWQEGYIYPKEEDGNVKGNEKVIPSKVDPAEYFKPHSRNGVAAIFGINPESIRTAHNNAIKKLRHPGCFRVITGEVVENVLFVKGIGYIKKEHIKYPAYLYIKHDTHFKELVEGLEKLGVDVHSPLAKMTEETTDKLVCDLFDPRVVRALEHDANCYKLSDIAKMSGYELLCIKGVGYHAYQKIIELMKENDFEFL